MCRWIAYIGKPIFIDTLVTTPSYSLVEQSLNSRASFKPDGSVLSTNGDGFGLGWYMHKDEAGVFKTAEPAWANDNINEICSQVQARIFMAHIRAASTGSIQRSNSHPFKYKNWIFQHNGYLTNFDIMRQELQGAIASEYFLQLKGTTDSETLFLLALTNGMQENPKLAWEKTIRQLRDLCVAKNITFDLIMSCSISDGKSLYSFRYSSTQRIHSQYYSTHADCMKAINENSDDFPKNSVVVVSEPLDQSMEHWIEMPAGSFATFQEGGLLRGSKAHIEMLDI